MCFLISLLGSWSPVSIHLIHKRPNHTKMIQKYWLWPIWWSPIRTMTSMNLNRFCAIIVTTSWLIHLSKNTSKVSQDSHSVSVHIYFIYRRIVSRSVAKHSNAGSHQIDSTVHTNRHTIYIDWIEHRTGRSGKFAGVMHFGQVCYIFLCF